MITNEYFFEEIFIKKRKKKSISINDRDEDIMIAIPHFFLKLFTTQSRLLTILRKRAFENIVGKGENAGDQHFLLFPQCFLPYHRSILPL